ncbi:hypothetical protein B0H19DRAFT_1080436 [Mycena capillaripes]|nr:hypothetical protein B0H19DRAFT_1080436 [Mycena capillaripes]
MSSTTVASSDKVASYSMKQYCKCQDSRHERRYQRREEKRRDEILKQSSYILLLILLLTMVNTDYRSAMNAAPSNADKEGFIYRFTGVDPVSGLEFVKYGFTSQPEIRMDAWDRQCWPEAHNWGTFFGRFLGREKQAKRVIHRYFKHENGWMVPKRCPFCGVLHQEKFSVLILGSIEAADEEIERLFTEMGWSICRITIPERE